MSGKQIHFLSPSVAGVVADRKAAAAARSEARSHAAKISYPEEHRVQRKSTGTKLSGQERPSNQRRAGSEESQSDRQSDASSPESTASATANVNYNYKGKPHSVTRVPIAPNSHENAVSKRQELNLYYGR